MNNRYFAAIKKYSWVLLVCVVLGAMGGFFVAKSQTTAFQVTSIVVVKAGAPGTLFSTTTTPQINVTESNDEATVYSTEIQGSAVMQFVYTMDPKLKQRGYTVDDLLLDVAASSTTSTSPVTSSSTGSYASGPFIFITATTDNASEAVLLANDVATGFVAYNTLQAQQFLKAQRDSLNAQLQSFQAQSTKLEQELLANNNPTTAQYSQLNSDRNAVNNQIDKLETQILDLPSTVIGDAFVSQAADASQVTSSGKSSLIIAASAGAGVLVGILLLLLLIFLDNGLYKYEQIREKLGLAYLGGLVTQGGGGLKMASPSGANGPRLADIRTSLRLTGVLPGEWRAPQGVVLLVTSPQDAEGKTTFAAALAATTARAGGTVVVVDGNLRRPATHLAFKTNPAGLGLSGLLKGAGREPVDEAVIRSSIPNVWLVPGGAALDDPTLLLDTKLPGILGQLRKKADLVIIDGPSLLSRADASLLATMVDGVAMVLDLRHAKLPVLNRTKELLKSLTHTPAGVVMNRMSGRGRKNQYYATAFPAQDGVEPKPLAMVEAAGGTGNGYAVGVSTGSGQLGAPMVPVSAPPGGFGNKKNW